jgi:hypothetical protein
VSLKETFKDRTDIYVSRVVKKTDINLYGFVERLTSENILTVISRDFCGRTGPIGCGPIRYNAYGVGSVRVKCPIDVAVRMIETGRIQIGWSSIRMRLAKNNPVRCYKCWASGHLSYNCPEQIDRRGSCFRCGTTDHAVGECDRPVNCLISARKNLRSDHWTGGPHCPRIPPTERYRNNTYRD